VTVQRGGTFVYTIEKPITNWNLNHYLGNTFDGGEVLEQIYPSVFNASPDLTHLLLNTDLMRSARLTDRSPQTVVYRIRKDARWSDGVPIDVADFRYAWKTQNGRDCPRCAVASTAGTDQIKSIRGSRHGKRVKVVFRKPYADWKGLFGVGYGLMPAHVAAQHGSLAHSFNHYFADNPPSVSGGPFVHDSGGGIRSVTLARNSHYYGAKAKLDTLKFKVISKVDDEVRALRHGKVDAIYPVPTFDSVNRLRNTRHVKTTLRHGLTWEHFDFNLFNTYLNKRVLRRALLVALNRQQLIDATVGQFAPTTKPLNNRIVMPQQAGYRDNVSEFHFGLGDIQRAKQILTDAGYTGVGTNLRTPGGTEVPNLRLRYTAGNAIRQDECNLFKQAAAELGVTINVKATDNLGATLTHASNFYDYDIVIFAWVGAPFFSSNEQIYSTFGGSNFGGYSNATVDRLLRKARHTLDRADAVALYNKADRLVSKDAYTLPLYQRPNLLAVYKKWGNVRDNGTNQGPPWNAQRWGRRA
jgi:peptide/nickel transport system substrate-binding protein